MNELKIFKQGRMAGTLVRTQHGASFAYAADYLSTSIFEGISFHMPKRVGPYVVTGVNVHPFFAGLLPEGLRLKAMIRGLKTSDDDLFSLLAALGLHVVGDVSAARTTSAKEYEVPKLKEISFHKYFEQLIQNPVETMSGHDVFAGVQNKISASMISFPLNIAKKNKAYILKLNNRDFPRIVLNENACLKLAKRCGLDVCVAKTVKDREGEMGLLVERFDREWNEEKNHFEQFHLEDACQFSDRYPADKYLLSLNEIAGQMFKWTSSQVDVLSLLEQYAFSYLICNGDMHAKNISLIKKSEKDGIRISPAYDLVSTLPYGDQKMALKIDGRDANIKARTLIEFAARFGIADKVITGRLDRLLTRFKKNLVVFLGEMAVAIDDDRKQSHLESEIKTRIKDLSL